MAFYWVNLGTTYKEVVENKFLWAPAYSINEKGKKHISHGWKAVPKVKKGDVIFCHKSGYIEFIAKAIDDAIPGERPKGKHYNEWKKNGYRINVDLEILYEPHNVDEFKEEFISRYNEYCNYKVYNVDKKTTECYMLKIPAAAAKLIADTIGNVQTSFVENESSDEGAGQTEKESIVNTRVGQNKFRRKVLDYWSNTCPITGINMPGLLIASHIYPWKLSTDKEKLDKFNGIALSPNADKLFDKGLISFSSLGEIIINSVFSRKKLESLGISPKLKIKGLTAEHIHYLNKHHDLFNF